MSSIKPLWLVGLCALAIGVCAIPSGCQKSQPPATTPSVAESSGGGTPEAPPEEPAAEPVGESAADAGSTEEKNVPAGLPPLRIPSDNPMTPEKIELGKLLYFDKRLSKDKTIACFTCHDPTKGWAEHTPTSTGIDGQVGGRNSPTVTNAAYATSQFWDGRMETLEQQALGPIENPIEMGHKLPDLVKELNEIAGYKDRFQKVFQTDVTADGIAKAIAAFERTVLSGNSPYDKSKAGDEKSLNDLQKRGLELFVAHQRALVLFFAGDLLLGGDVLGGLDHRVAGPRVVAETVHDPVFFLTRAARSLGVGVIDVGAVAAAVGRHTEHGTIRRGLDFQRGGGQRPGPGGTGLRDHRSRHALGADHPGKPGGAVHAVHLRHGHPEHDAMMRTRDRFVIFAKQPGIGGEWLIFFDGFAGSDMEF